ncbi:His/Gly/Thr/Pro-type tRNA ligase C-terminal domain-containing protein [Solwaraspora sp. WMMD406]|uniref:His/Gly/Thr/Pro-type tRNA ligase C-terminal domain-containing protein n=1 Tax=Solwaraspora sp. WMMD406 TaxID=3016095 RepID=UPI002417FD89|nr:His/Gly/Thr/Pro-type tRNA ligase C-terminal domain-containing protein [Solwaraspora sp. WMMD406]MDG4764291.1 His/Gly/Thr/Pro-type tRNA ligase C-terminal domain-containing protein [Solwaraspora sp. WMMD406]
MPGPAAFVGRSVAGRFASAGSVAETGERIHQRLRAERIDAVIDDRAERAGVKFRDGELVGVPLRVPVEQVVDHVRVAIRRDDLTQWA